MYTEGIEFIATAEDCGLSRLFDAEVAKLNIINKTHDELKSYDAEITRLESKKAEIAEAKELLEKYKNNLDYQTQIARNRIRSQFIEDMKDFNVICKIHEKLNDNFDHEHILFFNVMKVRGRTYANPPTEDILFTKDEFIEDCKTVFRQHIRNEISCWHDKSYCNIDAAYNAHMKDFISYEQFCQLFEEVVIYEKYMCIGTDIKDVKDVLEKIDYFNNTIKPAVGEKLDSFYVAMVEPFSCLDRYRHSNNCHYFFSNLRSELHGSIIETIQKCDEQQFINDCKMYDKLAHICLGWIGDLTHGHPMKNATATDERFKTNPILKTLPTTVFNPYVTSSYKGIDPKIKEFETEITNIDNYINELKQNRQELDSKREIVSTLTQLQTDVDSLKVDINSESNTHEKMLLTSKLIVKIDNIRTILKQW